MTLVNWILAIPTGLLGGLCILANWGGLIRWCVKRINYSQIMFVGGILLSVCLYQTPIRHWYIGFLIDPGVWIGAASLPFLIKQMLKK